MSVLPRFDGPRASRCRSVPFGFPSGFSSSESADLNELKFMDYFLDIYFVRSYFIEYLYGINGSNFTVFNLFLPSVKNRRFALCFSSF